MNPLFNWLGKADTIISLFTFLAAGYAAYAAWRRRRDLREAAKAYPGIENFRDQFADHRDRTTANPWVLSVNLLPTQVSARAEIEAYYEKLGQKVPEFLEISLPGVKIAEEDLERLLNELRRARHQLDQECATEVHLFIAGPVAAAVYIGAALDNWKLVKVFHHQQGEYHYWGCLQK